MRSAVTYITFRVQTFKLLTHMHFRTELTFPKDKDCSNYSLSVTLKVKTYFLNQNCVMFANIYKM